MTCYNKRVLHLAESLDPRDGGPSKSIPMLYKLRLDAGFKDSIATVHLSKFEIVDNFRKNSKTAFFGKLRFSPALIKHIFNIRKEIDIIHVNCVWNCVFVVGFFMGKLLRKNVILSTRGMLRLKHINESQMKYIVFNLFLKFTFKFINFFHVTSEWEKDNLIKMGVEAKKIMLIFNPTEDNIPKFIQHTDKKTNNIFTYLYVGRMHPFKRVLELIDAYNMIPKEQIKNTNLKLIGPWPDEMYYNKIIEKIRNKPEYADISLLNFKEGFELTEFYENCSVIVMPSKSENFGMAILEGLKFGKQVIVPKLSPWPKILSPDFMEIVSEDASNLKDCLIRAKEKNVFKDETISKIKESIKIFDNKTLLKQYSKMYEQIK